MVEYKRIQLRRDTSENWHTENPVLMEGEIGVDLTSNNIKIGDGSTAWNDLDYVHSDVDLSDYYTKEETDDVVECAKDALQSIIDTKVDNDTYNEKIGEIETNLEGKADRTDIPSLNGYATEAWVEGKGYLTEHQSLDGYYTKEEIDVKQQAIDNALATKADATETANRFNSVDEYLEQLHTEVEKKADAASVPTKTSELENDSNFLTEHQSLDNYYTKEETDTAIQGAKDALQDEINTKVDNDTYEAKIGEIEGVLEVKADRSEIPSLSGYATESWVEEKGYLTEHQPLKTINGETIVGDGDIEIKGGEGLEIFDLKTRSTDEKIALYNVLYNGYECEYLLKYGEKIVTNYYKSGNKVILTYNYSIALYTTSNELITNQLWLENSGNVIQTSGKMGYGFIIQNQKITIKQGEVEKGSFTTNQSVANTITLDPVPTKTSDLTNDSGFLTEHQSLDGYYTKEETNTKLANKVEQTEFVERCEAIEQSVPTNTETWTFELEDGSTITKEIYLK